MSDLKQAVERLSAWVGSLNPNGSIELEPFNTSKTRFGKGELNVSDLRLVLSALSRAEAERDLLAADVREAEVRGIRMGAAMARDMLMDMLNPAYVGTPTFMERVVGRLAASSTSVTASATDAAGVLEEGK